MDRFEKIDTLLNQHGLFINELNSEINKIKKDDIYIQNSALNKELTLATESLKENTNLLATLKEENTRLKNELYEQLFNEKTKLTNTADGRLNAYFSATLENEKNKLTQFEIHVTNEINKMAKQLQQNKVSEINTVYQSLSELKEKVNSIVIETKQEAEHMQQEIFLQKSEGIEKLRQEPLTDEQIVKRAKQNNIESFLGLRIFNVLGILLIIVGIIAAGQFTYTYIPDTLKGIFSYILGIIMLTCGEVLNRKRPNIFSLGITAGGIAILYSSTALSFFLLNIISMYPALALCILTTIVAFILSRRYSSQTIAVFAVIGGYLPILSVSGDDKLVYYAMGYFVILNTFSLLVSVYKKWYISQFVGFVMNIGSICYILTLLSVDTDSSKYFAIMYTALGFFVYNAIPIISTYKTGIKLKRLDNILLILNTIISSLMMFFVFLKFDIWDKTGLMAIVFCISYLFIAKIMEEKLKEETICQVLFYITGLAYAVIAIPLQLGTAYLSLGWLAEGTLLLGYGILSENKVFIKAGSIISGLCLFAFVVIDFWLGTPLLLFKYFCITLASIVILSILILKKKNTTKISMLYKCASIINLLLFVLYVIYSEVEPMLRIATDSTILSAHFVGIIATTVSLCYTYILTRQKFISDGFIHIISMAIYVLSIISILFINTDNSYLYRPEYPSELAIIGTTLIIVINVLAILAVRDIIMQLTLGKKLGIEWAPLILSGFFVFVTMQNLIVIFDLSLNNILITAIFAVTALGWILFGFIKRYHYIRLFGLGLSFLTVIKFFIVDLSFLSEGMRIASYFMLGTTLLAISFVYQYFSKKLDIKKESDNIENI